MKHTQKGATLIVVLVLLVAITILGVFAVRQSMVSLGIATNSQAQQLLLQNSDAAQFQITDINKLAFSLTKSGVLGMKNAESDRNAEVVFCYRSDQSEFFDTSKYSIMEWRDGTSGPNNNSEGLDGYCSVSSASGNFFTSGRKAVMTQIAVKYMANPDGEKFQGYMLGGDPNSLKLGGGGGGDSTSKVYVYAVSLMPSLATAQVSATKIDECLSQRMNEVTPPKSISGAVSATARESVTECLTNLNVPFTSHVGEYLIQIDFAK